MNGYNNRVVVTGMGILSPLGLDTTTTDLPRIIVPHLKLELPALEMPNFRDWT